MKVKPVVASSYFFATSQNDLSEASFEICYFGFKYIINLKHLNEKRFSVVDPTNRNNAKDFFSYL